MDKQDKFVTLNIGSSKIVSTLLAILTVLVLASVITQAIRFLFLDPEIHRFSRFNLDVEGNIPTYFSTMILLFSAILLGTIALIKKKESDPLFLTRQKLLEDKTHLDRIEKEVREEIEGAVKTALQAVCGEGGV